MTLYDGLRLPERGCISLVGGGGKTTLLLRLAEQFSLRGQSVVVTTTTHMLRKQGEEAGPLLYEGDADSLADALRVHPVVCIGTPAPNGKLSAPSEELLNAAFAQAHWVMAEVDGARCLPIKAPAAHEPVLLDSGLVIAVAGLSALGRPLNQICFRFELACELLGASAETILTPKLLGKLLTSQDGQYKGVEDLSRFRVVLNQGDDEEALALGRETAAEIQRHLPGCPVVLTALLEDDCVKEVF